MELCAFRDFNETTQDVLHAISKLLACIARIRQHIRDVGEAGVMQTKCCECACPVRDIGGRDVNRMGETLRIHSDMAIDVRHQLATIAALLFGGARYS